MPDVVASHHMQRVSVACNRVVLAAELHTVGAHRRALVCFVPGGAVDPRRERPITSTWEHEQLQALSGADCDGLTMNFPGVGSSRGELADNTLRRRGHWVQQVLDAAMPRTQRAPLMLVGCSMGAHITALIASRLDAFAVALVAPAAYGAHAEHEPFGPRLSAALRRPESWQDSPAFAAIRRYPGSVLFLLPEHDDVIPPAITRAYLQAAGHRSRVVSLPGATHHMLSRSSAADLRARREVCRQIAELASHAPHAVA